MIRNDTLRAIIDAFNRHDAAAYAAGYTPDAIIHDTAYPEPLRGTAAIERDITSVITAFPDAKMQIVNEVEHQATLAGEYVLQGTHTGPLVWPGGQVPATGKSVKVVGAFFARLDRGRLVDEHRYFDFAGMLSQLGLLQ
jgi:steroid delta-isomerase-like uncharacterized protein